MRNYSPSGVLTIAPHLPNANYSQLKSDGAADLSRQTKSVTIQLFLQLPRHETSDEWLTPSKFYMRHAMDAGLHPQIFNPRRPATQLKDPDTH